MVVGIIGGGASGMAAAIAASENPNTKVIIFERQARVGRKLLATGNGRCNLSNTNCAPDQGYHGNNPEFVSLALSRFGTEETIRWFHNLGLFTVTEETGRIYPYSDQANSVVDVLRFALEKPNVSLLTGFEVQKVKKVGNLFRVESDQETIDCDRLIIACGGLAGTKLGGSMSGYKLLKSFGHHVTKLRPSLVQLKSSWSGVNALKGVRTNCRAKILRDGEELVCRDGQLQFTEYGLSGPIIFEISRDVCQKKGEWVCQLDFLPGIDGQTLFDEVIRRRVLHILAQDILTGILHNRLGRILAHEAGIDGRSQAAELDDSQLRDLVHAVKEFDVSLTEPMGMDTAQVTAGGILTEEFNDKTMESKIVPGLYACGEVLDIDGDCGGYNLQWAWSSGRMAGYAVGEISINDSNS